LPEQFNLRHLKNVVQAIHHALDNSGTEIHEHWDYWHEIIKTRRSSRNTDQGIE
jgi:hypothetical protein